MVQGIEMERECLHPHSVVLLSQESHLLKRDKNKNKSMNKQGNFPMAMEAKLAPEEGQTAPGPEKSHIKPDG